MARRTPFRELLEEEEVLNSFLELPDLDDFREMVFTLRYKRYGGSGTNLTHSDIMDFDWSRITQERELLERAWDIESRALKSS